MHRTYTNFTCVQHPRSVFERIEEVLAWPSELDAHRGVGPEHLPICIAIEERGQHVLLGVVPVLHLQEGPRVVGETDVAASTPEVIIMTPRTIVWRELFLEE